MMMLKRGQFFLLAAVIISVVVLSLSVVVNRAVVSEDLDGFYDFSYDVEREVGAVIDYEIYTNIAGGKIDDFVNLLAEEIGENSPGADFMFIYGNRNNIVARSYANDEKDDNVVGTICVSVGSCIDIYGRNDNDFSEYDIPVDESDEEIEVKFKDTKINIPVSKYNSVTFIMRKDVGDETFVTVR